MGALAASDVTYTITSHKKLEDGRRIVDVTLAFGDGIKTYPSGGIPISIGKLACPTVVNVLDIIDNAASGYLFTYDKANKKLRMLQAPGMPAHAHPLLLKDAQVADDATTRVNVGTAKLGANTGGSFTIAGANANGGVQNVAAASDLIMNELGTSVAPAAQTLKCMVIGY